MSYETYDHTVQAEIELYLCDTSTVGCGWYSFDAYDYTHELGWEFNGDTVSSGAPRTDGNGNHYLLVHWDYQGDEDNDLNYHSDNLYVRSYRKGHFIQTVAVNGPFDRHQYPEIELLGDNNGNGNVISTETQ